MMWQLKEKVADGQDHFQLNTLLLLAAAERLQGTVEVAVLADTVALFLEKFQAVVSQQKQQVLSILE
jgi:hypothetical protein